MRLTCSILLFFIKNLLLPLIEHKFLLEVLGYYYCAFVVSFCSFLCILSSYFRFLFTFLDFNLYLEFCLKLMYKKL